MNLFFREMKAARKSLILWCIGSFLMAASGMAKFEGLDSTGESLQQLVSTMPRSLQAVMGTGSLDLSTAVGYYGILFTYLLLMAAIHSLMLGAGIIAKEERGKTAEFLLSKPISRSRIMTAKLAAALVNVLIFNLVTFVFSVISVAKFAKTEDSISDLSLLMTGMFLVQLMFLAAGSGIAASGKKPKRAVSMGTALLLAAYILSIAIDLSQKLEFLQYLTPFKYFEAKRVLIDGGLDPVFILLSIGIVFILTIVAYISFNKRDIQV
ncbi:ABC transporter permease subunit [Neobacillus mesonae]|uniref:ABC transporter permease subunit n=1 Tax=Neobacillus mesonae TaxID=1193713 RepID=UPI0020408FE8|nr:ABC transporter permease subunit [Neobacillus mesonae]MCM3567101.1 ABC transporter permease [Neobacillus mesonae]